ncbi:CoA pyrophosphatase [Undibacterium aquatile]|uniref:CoA pyrophosphatase n=1 Tax=Undibacterium aquatile TaxID=1537398 RepID=A0ABR6XG52_9BURK|nr:CoA pyrophosphatase [Undibacterium aquatile]MBC3811892.1 CoA pyrophosphatase [Undibacterium aquatile]
MTKLILTPEHLPIHSIADEAAIEADRLTPEWLRQRFSSPPIWTPESNNEELMAVGRIFRPASVLIPIVMREKELTLLLTERAAHLQQHAGQISFPGGRFEIADGSAAETALRETEEEVGLPRSHIDILGALPDYKTGTGYQVSPIVSLVKPPFDTVTDPGEVASVFEVPLAFLMNARHHQRRVFQMPDGSGSRMFYAMPYQDRFIWGATAGMLRNLFHFLRA